MLVLPDSIIQDRIDNVRSKVSSDIIKIFIIPFVIFSVIMMIITSFFLNKISTQITEPIIELYEKIKLIIKSHQKEKEQLINDQNQINNNQNAGHQRNKFQIENERRNNEFNIMLNYKPRNNEINVLYLAFSNLTKTIKVARNSLYEGDDN